MRSPASIPELLRRIAYRSATSHDIEAIAELHADSWRRHYRGAYSDEFLDGDVVADRLTVWKARLAGPPPQEQCTIVAECDGAIVGLAHTIFDYDRQWGALLDNLHVRHDFKDHGIGTRLMAETARALIQRRCSSGLYLWVLEGNGPAQAFYEGRGGECVGREGSEPPGGGIVVGLRYVWPDPAVLLKSEAAA